ncbi:MAG: GNAT family N-acetyltransferase [Halioglobus sp.]
MTINIRKADQGEIELLSEIAIASKAHWGYSSEFIDLCKHELTVTPEKFNAECFTHMAYECDGVILGFYAIGTLNDKECELDALFVRPDSIGTGVGKALIKHAIAFVAHQGFDRLIINSDPNAERFYLAAGAILIGEEESNSIKGRYLPVLSIPLHAEQGPS